MSQHTEHFEPICRGCLVEAADVLLLVLLAFLVMLSIRQRLTGGSPGQDAQHR